MNKYISAFFVMVMSVSLSVNAQVSTISAASSMECEGGEVSSLLKEIETNNTTLVTLRAEVEAQKLANRTGITLPDPEVGLKRMWEGAEESGKLTEITVTQSIDLATVMGQRVRLAQHQDVLVDEEYKVARMDILLEAKLVCIDLSYYNALAKELERRLTYARDRKSVV